MNRRREYLHHSDVSVAILPPLHDHDMLSYLLRCLLAGRKGLGSRVGRGVRRLGAGDGPSGSHCVGLVDGVSCLGNRRGLMCGSLQKIAG